MGALWYHGPQRCRAGHLFTEQCPEETPLERMAWRKTHRYLIERSNEDAKGEIGWDEFQTRKDPALLEKYEVEVLLQLSVGNVRELLRAAFAAAFP